MMNRKNWSYAEVQRKIISLLASQPAAKVAQIINDTYLTHFTPQRVLNIAEGKIDTSNR